MASGKSLLLRATKEEWEWRPMSLLGIEETQLGVPLAIYSSADGREYAGIPGGGTLFSITKRLNKGKKRG